MSTFPGKPVRFASMLLALTALVTSPGYAQQPAATQDSAIIQGRVCDTSNLSLPDVTVSLETQSQPSRKLETHTDSQGRYRFEAVPAGTYTLRARSSGHLEPAQESVAVRANEIRSIVLRLPSVSPSASAKDSSASFEFSDEPKFTVAGVTDPTNLGGHGSDVVLRTKEALAKDTASLKQRQPEPTAAPPRDLPNSAEDHSRLADAAEREGRSLDAVREYQRAAELDPSEPHLFAWGAELLLHRASEPAIEVFTNARDRYPNSVRILLGLSAATYSRGSTEAASRMLLEACDLDPKDPAPYLFLGRLQESEKIDPLGWAERLKRFATLHSENALAHYYYAVSLEKQANRQNSAAIEVELNRAIELDPRLGSAYLRLGVLFSERKEFPQAVAAFRKAIEFTVFPDEAHYRLAQLYRQTGEVEKARAEIAEFNRVSQQKTDAAERERHGIQQFVYTLE